MHNTTVFTMQNAVLVPKHNMTKPHRKNGGKIQNNLVPLLRFEPIGNHLFTMSNTVT